MITKRTLAAVALTLLTSTAQATEVLKWAWEDANNDSVWNYSTVNWNYQSGNQWNNVPLTRDAYQGNTALYLKYLNKDLNENGSYVQAFAFSIIPTSYAENGREPNSTDESNAGHDVTSYNNLEFYIKGTAGANQSNLNVWLRSPNGYGSVFAPLKNYVTVNGNWQKVSIPVKAFQFNPVNPNGFQMDRVHSVGFYVNQDNANVPFEIKVDNISFIKTSSTPTVPLARAWWSEDANHNGEYNYSATSTSNGASVNTANQWGDAKISDYMTGPYGNSPISSIDLNFYSNAYGRAEAALTTSRANNGHEPLDPADRDAGKAIHPGSALKFASPGTNAGVYVKLVDAYGKSSKAVSINDYRSSYGRYTFDFAVPVSKFTTAGFNLNAVRSINFFVDGSSPAGNYPLHLTVLKFDRP